MDLKEFRQFKKIMEEPEGLETDWERIEMLWNLENAISPKNHIKEQIRILKAIEYPFKLRSKKDYLIEAILRKSKKNPNFLKDIGYFNQAAFYYDPKAIKKFKKEIEKIKPTKRFKNNLKKKIK